jgi:hypothetical protein
MKKKIILLAILISLLICSTYFLKKYIESQNNCQITQLLLDESDYPTGTTFDVIRSPIDEKPRESASRSSYYLDSWIRENVIMYRSTEKAYEIYIEQRDARFDLSEIYDEWKIPLRSGVDDVLANHYHSGCGNVKNMGYRCIFLAQYEKYIVILSIDVSNNGITEELFRDLVMKMDEEMFACLVTN